MHNGERQRSGELSKKGDLSVFLSCPKAAGSMLEHVEDDNMEIRLEFRNSSYISCSYLLLTIFTSSRPCEQQKITGGTAYKRGLMLHTGLNWASLHAPYYFAVIPHLPYKGWASGECLLSPNFCLQKALQKHTQAIDRVGVSC